MEVRLVRRHRRRRTRHLGHHRRRRRAPPAGKGPGRSAKGTGIDHSQTRTTRTSWPRRPNDVVAKIRDRQRVAQRGNRPDHRQAGRAAMTLEPPEWGPRISAAPTPDEIASLLQVEHLLDQRWPETKHRAEPDPDQRADGPARLTATRLSVDPHRRHQRQDLGGADGRRAADRAAAGAPAAPPARTCSRRSSASRSTESRSARPSTWRRTARSSRSCR